MQKKLLTVAVASALAMPAVALAQVTVYGTMDGGLRQHKIPQPSETRAPVAHGAQPRDPAQRQQRQTQPQCQAKIKLETEIERLQDLSRGRLCRDGPEHEPEHTAQYRQHGETGECRDQEQTKQRGQKTDNAGHGWQDGDVINRIQRMREYAFFPIRYV